MLNEVIVNDFVLGILFSKLFFDTYLQVFLAAFLQKKLRENIALNHLQLVSDIFLTSCAKYFSPGGKESETSRTRKQFIFNAKKWLDYSLTNWSCCQLSDEQGRLLFRPCTCFKLTMHHGNRTKERWCTRFWCFVSKINTLFKFANVTRNSKEIAKVWNKKKVLNAYPGRHTIYSKNIRL